ncbi:C40 family peptidase [Azonexus sp.]|uniref:C40 family peptidase n=1 Tax=Azonexus sp. TaxID=1872668 RepID=UPI0035B1F01A
MRRLFYWLSLLVCLALAACGSPGPRGGSTITQGPRAVSGQANEVVMLAMGLIDTGYRFGGKNPEAGFDCSGMVAYVFAKAAGVKVSGSAADIARRGRAVSRHDLQPGDLVFFNTMNRPFSHVGIYIGEQRFVHAPSTNGRVRIERLDSEYFARRYEAARTLLD